MKHKFYAIAFLLTMLGQFNLLNAEFFIKGLFQDSAEDYISDVALRSVSILIQPHGSYLDITEKATIMPMQTDLNSIIDYWVEGSILIPKKSTIVQVIFSDSAESYSSRILPVYKENHPVDTSLGEPLVVVTSKRTMDDIFESDDNFDSYNMKINRIEMGKLYKISIRYLVPNTGNAMPIYALRILCHNDYNRTGFIEFKYKSTDIERAYSLCLGNDNFQLENDQSLQIRYQQNYKIMATDKFETSHHVTSFENGDYKGKYLLLNTTVPDSVITLLSKPIELIFLWRWNKPSSFVKKYSNESSAWLTSYGQQATIQAAAINVMVKDVAATGNQIGMVHSIQYRKPDVFPLCKKNSAAFTVLNSYLSQIDADYIINSGYYEEITAPTGDTMFDSSRAEFMKSMTIVKGLYSNGAGIMKHLIIVTCGPIRNSTDIITMEELDPLLNGISVYSENAYWKDVSFANVEGSALSRDLTQMNGFYVPEFRPSSLILEVTNSAKRYSFPMSINQKAFTIIAKSEGDWNQKMVWYGYDRNGEVFDTASSMAAIYDSKMDTGLVKLWAANKERLSEKLETGIAAQYGVISEDYSMRVYDSNKGNDSVMGYATTHDYYSPDQPLPVKNDLFKNVRFICTLKNRILKIALPGNEEIKRIKIYSLTGTLIAEVNPALFKTASEYLIPLKAIFTSKISSMVVITVEGKSSRWTQKVWIRN